jgi:hypothetical protein
VGAQAEIPFEDRLSRSREVLVLGDPEAKDSANLGWRKGSAKRFLTRRQL